LRRCTGRRGLGNRGIKEKENNSKRELCIKKKTKLGKGGERRKGAYFRTTDTGIVGPLICRRKRRTTGLLRDRRGEGGSSWGRGREKPGPRGVNEWQKRQKSSAHS